MANDCAKIYEYLFKRACPIELESPWDFLEVDRDARLASFEPGLLRELNLRFDISTLRKARIVVTRQGVEVLNPLLARPNQTLILLRNRDKQPVDILTEQGCLSRNVPLFAAHQAARGDATRQSRQVFVPFAARDLVILRSLGLTAAPAWCLDRLSPDGLQQLLYRTGGDSSGPIPRRPVEGAPPLVEDCYWHGEPEDEPPAFEVSFCAFSLASLNLDIPAALAPVADHLTGAEECLGINWDGLHVWHPGREIEKLKYLVRLRSAKIISQFMLDQEELYELTQYTSGYRPPRQKSAFVQSLQDYERSLDRYRRQDTSNDLQALKDAEKDYQQQIDALLFESQVEAALANTDPALRNMQMLQSHLFRSAMGFIPRMHDEVSRFAEEGRDDLLSPEKIQQLESIINMVCKLGKSISDRSSEGAY